MACKTVLKRTAKRAPISSEMLAAIAADDVREAGLIDVEIEQTRQQSPAEAVKVAVAAKAAEARASEEKTK
jgi:recombinational DNA repair protein RecT